MIRFKARDGRDYGHTHMGCRQANVAASDTRFARRRRADEKKIALSIDRESYH